jgi:hypothetical protein
MSRAAPPFDAGAAHVTIAWTGVKLTLNDCGAPGTVADATAAGVSALAWDGLRGAAATVPGPAWTEVRAMLAPTEYAAADPGGRWGDATWAGKGPGRVTILSCGTGPLELTA